MTAAMLLALQPPWGAETPLEFRTRMAMLASVTNDLPDAKGLGTYTRPAVIAVWHGETRFDVEVHKGLPGRWGSDKGRARCLGQIHKSGLVPGAKWKQLAGLDRASTARCASATRRILYSAWTICRSRNSGRPTTIRRDLARMFGLYATGSRCQTGKREYSRADVAIRLRREAVLNEKQARSRRAEVR